MAVLLGLCRELQESPAPVRVIFFDREEAWLKTPFLRLGLLGSLCYVFTTGLRDIDAVYNLEFCGRGDALGVWPVRDREKALPAVRAATAAAAELKVAVRYAHVPWLLLSSDHLSFRFKGLANAVTLSLLPADQLPALEKMISGLSLPGLLFGGKPELPEVLASVHTVGDTSSRLSEEALQLMLSLLREIVRGRGAP